MSDPAKYAAKVRRRHPPGNERRRWYDGQRRLTWAALELNTSDYTTIHGEVSQVRDLELPSERIAWAAWQLARGQRFTAAELASHVGISHSGAAKLLERVSAALPITVIGSTDDGGHIWAAMDSDDAR